MEAILILYPASMMVFLTAILYTKNYFDIKKHIKIRKFQQNTLRPI